MNENEIVTKKADPANKLRFALMRVLAALLVAAIIFILFYTPILALINKPAELGDIHSEPNRAFVYTEISFNIGVYEETGSVKYALVPMSGKFVTVRFTGRYAASADKLLANTYDYINGNIDFPDEYITVQGVVGTLTEAEAATMYDWFALNYDQLVEMRMIAETDDYADYLSDRILMVDHVTVHHQNIVFAVMGVIGLLALYVLLDLCFMALGVYRPTPEYPAPAEAADEPAVRKNINQMTLDDFTDGDENDDAPASSAPESEGGAETEMPVAEADGEDLGEPNLDDFTEGDDAPVESAPESEGGAETELPPAEADGEGGAE